ncbi:hypothetical protein D3C81_924090 [compost metagenome]
MGKQGRPFVGVAALPGKPRTHGARGGELMQRRRIARYVQQGQAAARIAQAEDVARWVAIDVQQPGVYPVGTEAGAVVPAFHACRPPHQAASLFTEVAPQCLPVAGSEECDARADAVLAGGMGPEVIELAFEYTLEVELPDEGLEGRGVELHISAGVVAHGCGLAEKAMEFGVHIDVVVQAASWQFIDDRHLTIAEGLGPGRSTVWQGQLRQYT